MFPVNKFRHINQPKLLLNRFKNGSCNYGDNLKNCEFPDLKFVLQKRFGLDVFLVPLINQNWVKAPLNKVSFVGSFHVNAKMFSNNQ